MALADDGEVAVGQALDQVHLPQGPAPVERPAHEARHELVQLVARAGLRQRRPAHVVRDVEALVVDPDRTRHAERHVADALAVPGHVGDALLDQAHEALVVETARRRGEDGDPAGVHRRAGGLHEQEGGVEGGHAIGHAVLPRAGERSSAATYSPVSTLPRAQSPTRAERDGSVTCGPPLPAIGRGPSRRRPPDRRGAPRARGPGALRTAPRPPRRPPRAPARFRTRVSRAAGARSPRSGQLWTSRAAPDAVASATATTRSAAARAVSAALLRRRDHGPADSSSSRQKPTSTTVTSKHSRHVAQTALERPSPQVRPAVGPGQATEDGPSGPHLAHEGGEGGRGERAVVGVTARHDQPAHLLDDPQRHRDRGRIRVGIDEADAPPRLSEGLGQSDRDRRAAGGSHRTPHGDEAAGLPVRAVRRGRGRCRRRPHPRGPDAERRRRARAAQQHRRSPAAPWSLPEWAPRRRQSRCRARATGRHPPCSRRARRAVAHPMPCARRHRH